MASNKARAVINSTKPKPFLNPGKETALGAAGYDNVRDDIEKTKSLREAEIINLNVGTMAITSGSITDSSGAISFGDESLTTTGTGTFTGGLSSGDPGHTFRAGTSAGTYAGYFANNEMEIKLADTFTGFGIYLHDPVNFITLLKTGASPFAVKINNSTETMETILCDGTYAQNILGEITQSGTATIINAGDYKFFGTDGTYNGAIVDQDVGASGHFWSGNYDVTLGQASACAVFQDGTTYTTIGDGTYGLNTNGTITTTGAIKGLSLTATGLTSTRMPYVSATGLLTNSLLRTASNLFGFGIDVQENYFLTAKYEPTTIAANPGVLYFITNYKPSANTAKNAYAVLGSHNYESSYNSTGQCVGFYPQGWVVGNGNIDWIIGFKAGAYGTYSGTGVASNIASFYAMDGRQTGGTITTAYQIYLEKQTKGTTNYQLYSAGGDFELTDGNLTTSGTIKAGSYESSDGSAGATGSFTSADGKTITVKNGLITAIV